MPAGALHRDHEVFCTACSIRTLTDGAARSDQRGCNKAHSSFPAKHRQGSYCGAEALRPKPSAPSAAPRSTGTSCLHGQNCATPPCPPFHRLQTSPEPYHRQAAALLPPWRSSSPYPAERLHWPVAPDGAPQAHPAPARSALDAPLSKESRHESCRQAESIRLRSSSGFRLLDESEYNKRSAS